MHPSAYEFGFYALGFGLGFVTTTDQMMTAEYGFYALGFGLGFVTDALGRPS